MTRRSLRVFTFVAALGLATSALLDVCNNQAMAASTVNLDSGVSTYSLSYVNNLTITAATDSTVVPTANALGASPTFTTQNLTPVVVPPATVTTIGWAQASTGASWLSANNVGTAAGVTGTPTALDAPGNFGTGFTASNSAPQGFYYYTTTFTLTPGTYGISGGEWLSDNQGAAIFLNGINLAMTNLTQFSTPSAYSAPAADFITTGAPNTLTFVVFNENYSPVHSSPTGIEIEGTVTAVPEPTAIALVMSGLPLVGLYWAAQRRRRRASV